MGKNLRIYFGSRVNSQEHAPLRKTVSLGEEWEFQLDSGNSLDYEKIAQKK